MFRESINSFETFLKTHDRVVMYSVLSRHDIKVPDIRLIVGYVGNSNLNIDIKYPAGIFSPLREVGIDGVVTSLEGLKSILEYRAFMRNPHTITSILFRWPGSVEKCLVIDDYVSLRKYEDLALKICEVLNCKVCEIYFTHDEYVIDVNPVPELSGKNLIEKYVRLVKKVIKK
ncbi:MAG: hypothetical protein B6V02_01840 [Thermoprotei archaeon ex4572_64]|nr:MAG: hypothetical protein B6V02_01840 [Thermoprotei archaeon ex4572_64]